MDNIEQKPKHSRCRYAHLHMGRTFNELHCVADGWEDDKVKIILEQDCENCEKFESRYIEYPLTINGIENQPIKNYGIETEIGSLVEIAPCAEEYDGKSYLGIYLGGLPISINTSFDRNTGILKNSTVNNAAIFVPELKKIVYGCESWWREIESVEDFKGITTEDIENAWYVKLLKEMSEEASHDNKSKRTKNL